MIQPIIKKKHSIGTTLLNFLICIIPFGIVYVIVKFFSDIFKTKMPVYKSGEFIVSDKRYSGGSRVERTYRKRTGKKRELSTEEIQASRFNGKLRLYGLILYFFSGFLLYYSKI